MADQKVNRFMEGITLFDRELEEVKNVSQLYPLFLFLGGDEPEDANGEIALFKGYVKLSERYASFRLPDLTGDNVLFGSLLQTMETFTDERSQCEFMSTWYEVLKRKFEATKKVFSELKENHPESYNKQDEIELLSISRALKGIESAQARLEKRLEEIQNEEHKQEFSA